MYFFLELHFNVFFYAKYKTIVLLLLLLVVMAVVVVVVSHVIFNLKFFFNIFIWYIFFIFTFLYLPQYLDILKVLKLHRKSSEIQLNETYLLWTMIVEP